VLKANRGQIVEAEGLVALFNGALEVGHGPDSRALRERLHNFAWTPPGAEPREVGDNDIRAVCEAWHQMRALWNQLPIGGQLQFVWSGEAGEASRNRRSSRGVRVMHVAV
jgi:hypothetical protein